MNQLREGFGNIDIYLFDQILKGHYKNCHKIIDLGCGNGRNLVWFLKHGYEVYGIDQDPHAIDAVRDLVTRLAPELAFNNFRVGAIDQNIPFEYESFDLVICNAVLHFAENQHHFDLMLHTAWELLKPDGQLFVRTASSIGIEHLIEPIGDGRYLLPDNSELFLVDMKMLLAFKEKINAIQYEHIKTTNVQNLRAMTTWCLQK
jgi:tellurite methyltransferase